MRKQTLEQWVREVLTDSEKEGKCTSIALVHVVGMGDKEIDVVKFGARQWSDKELAARFLGKAESYAEGIAGTQTFNLLAFYADRSEPQAQKPFRVNTSSEIDTNSLGTEAPTKEGLTQQAMRHTEAVMQITARQTGMLFDASNQTIKALLEQNNQLMKENRDSFEIVRDMIMQQADKRHEHRMTELKFARQSGERKKLMGFAPVLINTVLGREVFPTSTTDTAIIERIAEELSEEDMMKLGQNLAGIVKPEVLGPLAQRMTAVLQSKRLENEAIQRIINGHDAEDDITGGPEH